MDSGYYIVIDGVKYERAILEMAELLIQGQGDGRISHEDAEQILDKIADKNLVTKTEQDSVDFILKQYTWTDKARRWFLAELEKIPKE